MKPIEVVVLGGCHAAGYPIGAEQAFPTLLGELVGGRLVGHVTHLSLAQLPEHLALIDKLRPTHVVLQLGNYEFADSFRQLWRQAGSNRLVPRPVASLPKASAKAGAPSAAPGAGRMPTALRTAGLALVLSLLWLLRPYRRSLRALNACLRRHPGVAFIFVSPLPSLNPTLNALRRLGGWLLRRRLIARPNCYWLDSHQLLPPARSLFADSAHLNRYAHQALAYGLAAVFLSNIDYLL